MNILDPLISSFSDSSDKYYGVEPETKAFLQKLADAAPIESLSPEEARKVLADTQQQAMVDLSGIDVRDHTVQIDGHTIYLNIVRPAGIAGRLPAVMFFHGGGWVLGDFPTHKRMVRDLCVETGCAVIFVNYGLSPESKYPCAAIECYLATKWVARFGHEIQVDGSNLAVAGNSAGGNLATIVCLMAKENEEPQIKHQTLFWPVTDAAMNTDSYDEFAAGFFLTRGMMEWFWNNYLEQSDSRKEIYTSPLKAAPQQLQGLPPALVLTAEFDVLRDEGEQYAHLLTEAGVKVTATRYLGAIHDFALLNPLAKTPAARNCIAQAGCEIRKYLAIR